MNFGGEECGEIGAKFLFRRLGILITLVGRMKYLKNHRPSLLDVRAFVYRICDEVTMRRVDEFIRRAACMAICDSIRLSVAEFSIYFRNDDGHVLP